MEHNRAEKNEPREEMHKKRTIIGDAEKFA